MRVLSRGKRFVIELSEKEFKGLLLILKKPAELYDGKFEKVGENAVSASN